MVAGRTRRLPILAVGVGVLLVLTTGIVLLVPGVRSSLGADLAPQSDPGPTTPTTSSASSASSTVGGRAAPTGSIDDATRRVTVNGASMLLPGDPYQLIPDPMYVDEVFDVCFLAEAAIHPRSATTPGWAAMVGLAHLEPELEQKLDTDGPVALTTITREFFGSYRTTVSDPTSTPTTVDGHPAMTVTATVHYAVPGLPSTHDDVIAVVVDLGTGGTVIAMTSVPDDAPKDLRTLAATSLGTLTVG